MEIRKWEQQKAEVQEEIEELEHAVSVQLKNLREALARDQRLQETLAQAEKRLESLLEVPKAEGRLGS